MFESSMELITTITELLKVTVWPALILFIILRFKKGIASFFSNLSEFKVKAAGVEASATRDQVKAAASLGAAANKNNLVDISEIADAVLDLAKSTSRKHIKQRILWVDDRPDNNIYEKSALEEMGIEFGSALSTEEALRKLELSEFDLIISDMGRPPDDRAGYTLLDTLRATGDTIPFVIYAGSRLPEHQAESKRRGAIGCTNRPDELFMLVSKGLILASRNPVR